MPNNSRRGWTTSPPPSGQLMDWPPPHQPVPYPMPHDLGMMLGRIVERTEATADQVGEMRSDIVEIKQQLTKGGARFDQIEREIRDLGEDIAAKQAPVQAPAPQASPAMSAPPPTAAPFLALMGPAIAKSLLGLVLLASASAGVLPWDVVKDIVSRLLGK